MAVGAREAEMVQATKVAAVWAEGRVEAGAEAATMAVASMAV